ncbi:hypothetical protein ACKFKG_11465 [Phormidesmis sp. 146-35]
MTTIAPQLLDPGSTTRVKQMISTMLKDISKPRQDLLAVMLVGSVSGLITYWLAHQIPANLYNFFDVWFQADLPLQFQRAAYPVHQAHYTKLHPLFSLVVFPVAAVFRLIPGVDVIESIRLLVSLVAGVWSGVLFLVVRNMGCRLLDASLLTCVAIVSATSLFWGTILETCQFAALGFLLTFWVALVSESRPVSPIWYVVANVVALGFTITNWLTSIIATLIYKTWRPALGILSATVGLVLVLYVIKGLILPVGSATMPPAAQASLTPTSTASSESPVQKTRLKFLTVPSPERIGQVLGAAIAHTMVMPEVMPEITKLPHANSPELLSIQRSRPGSGSVLGGVAVGLWTAILGLGVWNFFKVDRNPRFKLVLGASVVTQLGLFILFGEETFLYAPNFLALLLPVAALSTIGQTRKVALGLILCLLLSAGLNNFWQFQKTTALLNQAQYNALASRSSF